MKFINIDKWERKEHYNFFKNFDYPNYSVTANVDITRFYKSIKENNLPFFITLVYNASKTLNSIKEFRLRIREEKVVEHEVIHPSVTAISSNGVFNFCALEYIENFSEFMFDAEKKIEKTKNNIQIENKATEDNRMYITSLPWVSYTSVNHPIHMNPVSSVPIITWGKYFEENDKILIPFSVQVHHALIDGIHIGEYFNLLQKLLDNSECLLNTNSAYNF